MFSVDVDEIKRLGKRFRKLDLDNSGSLSIDEFMSLPELQQNPLVQRVIDIFDTDGNGEVDFKGEPFVCLVIQIMIIMFDCHYQCAEYLMHAHGVIVQGAELFAFCFLELLIKTTFFYSV